MRLIKGSLFALVVLFSNSALAKKYKSPLEELTVTLITYHSSGRENYRVNLTCQEDAALSSCQDFVFQVEATKDEEKKEWKEIERSMSLSKDEVKKKYVSVVKKSKENGMNPTLYYMGTEGTLNMANEIAPFAIAVPIGFAIDVVKLPFFAIYHLSSTINLKIKKRRLLRRFKKLWQNRPFKSVNYRREADFSQLAFNLL